MIRDNFDAVIVAGGRGVRMGPATDGLPKPMLPVGGKPLLEHQLLWLKNSGFNEAFLCLGYKAEAVTNYFADGRALSMTLHYQVEARPRGTAGAVRDLAGSAAQDLLIVYGDLFIRMDCAKLLDFHRSRKPAATLVVRETDHPLDSDLVRLDGDRITEFYRAQPGRPYENWAGAAVWVISRSLLDLIPSDIPTDFGRDIFPKAIAQGKTFLAYRTKEAVLDVGTPERQQALLQSGLIQ